MSDQNEHTPDKKFCQVALDSLKTYRHMELTIRFMKKVNLRTGKNLFEMWSTIERWLKRGDMSRCLDLLQYTDDLRMWGRQRVFLFEIAGSDGEREKKLKDLANPAAMRKKFGDLYHKALYRWEADEPFLADVRHERDPYTGSRMLILKLIETRKFEVTEGLEIKIFEKRSTNFFIVHLDDGYARLILEQLPRGARRDINAERRLFEEEINKYLSFEMFSPIPLEHVMVEMLRSPIYPITFTGFKAGQKDVPGASTLMIILNHLFRNPIPNQVSAYWECEQDVVNKQRLHFQMNGNNNCITFDGIADPNRIRDILKRVVENYRGVEKPEPPLLTRGWVHRPYKNLQGQPRAQAVILAAGAVAASLIWILIEGIGNYFLEEWVEKTFKGVPLVAFTLVIEFIWIWFYYGWRRIKNSFKALAKMKLSEIFQMIRKSREVVKKDRKKYKTPRNKTQQK